MICDICRAQLEEIVTEITDELVTCRGCGREVHLMSRPLPGRKFEVAGSRPRRGRIVKRPCRCGRELSLVVERDREPGVPVLEGQGSLFGQEPEQAGLFG